jgi:hypothetical protein
MPVMTSRFCLVVPGSFSRKAFWMRYKSSERPVNRLSTGRALPKQYKAAEQAQIYSGIPLWNAGPRHFKPKLL